MTPAAGPDLERPPPPPILCNGFTGSNDGSHDGSIRRSSGCVLNRVAMEVRGADETRSRLQIARCGENMITENPDCAASTVRVVNIYATPWTFNGSLNENEGQPLDLGGLEQHYTLYREQLPRLLPPRVLSDWIGNNEVELAQTVDGVRVADARAELFTLPSKQVVLAVTMSLAGATLTDTQQVTPIATVLDQGIFGQILLGSRRLETALPEKLPEKLPDGGKGFSRDVPGEPLLPERHQLIFVSNSTPKQPVPSQQVIDKILYRSTPPYRPEFVDPRRPEQLNNPREPAASGVTGQGRTSGLVRRHHRDTNQHHVQQPPTLGVVTPYASLLYGHRDYVEASIFLSTVHAVGTAARFRYIWREAYHQVLQFREQKQAMLTGEQTRDDLEILADNLGNLEFDLTFSVEFPLLRIETFQSDLYKAMDLDTQANTLSQMFDQLGGSLRSEITAIEVREQHRIERQKLGKSVAAGLLSLIGVPVGFVVAFLGINTTEVPDGRLSMWDPHYSPLYLIASSFALFPVFLIAVPYLWDIGEATAKRRSKRTLWMGNTSIVGGLTLSLPLMLGWGPGGLNPIIVAIAIPLGVFFGLSGLTLILAWCWRDIVAFVRLRLRGSAFTGRIRQAVSQ